MDTLATLGRGKDSARERETIRTPIEGTWIGDPIVRLQIRVGYRCLLAKYFTDRHHERCYSDNILFTFRVITILRKTTQISKEPAILLGQSFTALLLGR